MKKDSFFHLLVFGGLLLAFSCSGPHNLAAVSLESPESPQRVTDRDPSQTKALNLSSSSGGLPTIPFSENGLVSEKAPVIVKTAATGTKGNLVRTDPFLEDLLKSQAGIFDSILLHRKEWKVQILYTQIDRKANNNPEFHSYYFNIDSSTYFYPASTVKMPVALLALQRLNEMRLPGLGRNSSLITEANYSGQSPVYNDPSTPDGRPSVGQYVKKIFLVSDNDAFNRLYEFLGQQYINEQLHRMGYGDVEIRHRLQVPLSEDENRHTNPIAFYDPTGNLLYTQPLQFNTQPFSKRNDPVGEGYYANGVLNKEPMDFSGKNRISLEDLTEILKSVLFPSAVTERHRFNLSSDDYRFVRQYMSQLPQETRYPAYDSLNYWDTYCKFLMYGSQKLPLPRQIRIFNKVGDAYGFLTDVAYIVDFDKKIEFMLSARIYCNRDGILNDDKYDYDEIGYPFMKKLGQVIYNFELGRKRPFVPDLSEFKFNYDK